MSDYAFKIVLAITRKFGKDVAGIIIPYWRADHWNAMMKEIRTKKHYLDCHMIWNPITSNFSDNCYNNSLTRSYVMPGFYEYGIQWPNGLKYLLAPR